MNLETFGELAVAIDLAGRTATVLAPPGWDDPAPGFDGMDPRWTYEPRTRGDWDALTEWLRSRGAAAPAIDYGAGDADWTPGGEALILRW